MHALHAGQQVVVGRREADPGDGVDGGDRAARMDRQQRRPRLEGQRAHALQHAAQLFAHRRGVRRRVQRLQFVARRRLLGAQPQRLADSQRGRDPQADQQCHRRRGPRPPPHAPPRRRHRRQRPRVGRFEVEHALEVGGEGGGGRVAARRIALDGPQRDRLQVAREPRLVLARRHRITEQDALEHAGAATPTGEWMHERQRLVQHDAERVHVGRRRRRLAFDLLGRHVERRADDLADGRQSDLVAGLRQAEVEHQR